MERLGDFVRIRTGKLDANASSENGQYPFFTCAVEPLRIDTYTYDCECVLVAGNGDLNVKYYDGKFDAYQRTYIIESLDKNVLAVPYLYCFLEKYVETLRQQAIGGVIKYIKLGNLTEAALPIPSIAEQLEVVAKLRKANELISLRKEQLAKLDRLVKSRFIELFGDPMDNPMGWDRVNISAVVRGKVSNGFFAKRDDYCDDGNVKVLGVAHVVNRMYSIIEDLPTTNGTETDVAKYSVKYGDMLFCRSSLVAAGIGKASIVPQGTPNNVLFECHVIRLPLDLDKCVPEFMQVLSTTEYFRNQVIAQSKTATMTTIGQDGILKTDIILPPLEMQKQFLQFVEQTDKSKLAIQASLDKLELLKKSLMQEYFG
jgi:type I restriction enzyme S subunit